MDIKVTDEVKAELEQKIKEIEANKEKIKEETYDTEADIPVFSGYAGLPPDHRQWVLDDPIKADNPWVEEDRRDKKVKTIGRARKVVLEYFRDNDSYIDRSETLVLLDEILISL